MVMVIEGGIGGMDALMYPVYNPSHLQYFQNTIQQASQRLAGAGQQFIQKAQEVYERVNSSTAIQAARNVLKMVGNTFHNSTHIYQVNSLDQFQSATTTMQRWIMAEPTVRALYHEQRCDGYSDTYIDVEPGMIGDRHYDYRRVMDGVLVDDQESWVVKQYWDELKEGDRDLTVDEKVDILNTWDIMRMFIDKGKEDPTSMLGGTL